jgi:hypothetical protein
MTDQPPRHEHHGPPQFPDTPDARRARRELSAWVNLYKKEAEVQQERAELRAQLVRAEAAVAQSSNLFAVIGDLSRTVASLQEQVREKDAQIRDLQRAQVNHRFTSPDEEVRQLVLADAPATKEKKLYLPRIVAWRTWKGFRADIVGRYLIQQKANRENDITVPITIDDIAGDRGDHRGDSSKTIRKVMRECYGLDPDKDWPPTGWPKEDPRSAGGSIDAGHPIAAVLAIAPFVLMLDAILRDQMLDGIPHLTSLLGCLFHLHL